MNDPSAPVLLDMDEVKVDPAWALRVPASLATRRQVLPFAAIDGHVYVACANDQDQAALQAVERYVNMPVRAEAADCASLKRALNRIFGNGTFGRGGDGAPLFSRTIDPRAAADPDSSDSVALCDELLYAAMVREASDIHIDPGESNVLVRFRVDGVLEPYRQLPTPALIGVISRFKVLSGMDIAEKRSPQDGRFTHRLGPTSQKVDIRVATLADEAWRADDAAAVGVANRVPDDRAVGDEPVRPGAFRAGDHQAAWHDSA